MNIDQYKNYLVGDKQINGEKYGADRCTYVWKKLYMPLYSDIEFWKNTNFSKIVSIGAVLYNSSGYMNTGMLITGDALFNFKKNIKYKI